MELNSNYKILIVDDTRELLDIAVRTLKRAHYNVISASDGAECISVLEHERPDLILLDVMLPDIDGRDLAKKIKSSPDYSSIFIYLLSSFKTSGEDIAVGLEGRSDGYIVRPVNDRELLARVAAACRIINAERESAAALSKLKETNKELKKINSEKDKFFSIIAHDLNGPLHNVMGFSEVLIEQVRSDDREGIEECARNIWQSSQKATNLLMNLSEWAQSQTGRMKFNPEQFEIVSLINEIISLFDDTALKKSIIMLKSLPENAPFYADKAMISTVLRNLISNAIKFTEHGGTITISAREDQNNITISVSDTGVGIPLEVMDKLFTIDNDYTTPGTQNEKGTGLGLVLCREFVEKHSGKIWVNSEQGKGSTFSFSISK